MQNNNKNNFKVLVWFSLLTLLFTSSSFSQHRGDNLAFQGWRDDNNNGIKAVAMGRAYTSLSGDINSLFWNPAGLVGIAGPQFSIAANTYNQVWRENQWYRPNRQFVNLAFYLDRLYTPDPANNGIFDNQIFFDTTQTYFVEEPKLGLDPFSEEAADWQVSQSGTQLNNISGAYPLIIAEQEFVISAAYATQSMILDYDRNTTHLDPHIGSDEYGAVIERVTSAGDSVRVNWSDYNRERQGDLKSIIFGLGYKVIDNIKVGFSTNILSSAVDESQQITQLGYFDLLGGPNRFKFSYDSVDTKTTGNSDFSAVKWTLGAIAEINSFSIGVSFGLPYTVTREWNTSTTTDSLTVLKSFNSTDSGTDELSIPLSYAVGISFKPVNELVIAFNFGKNNYSNAEFSFAHGDSTNRGWVDQTIVGFGVEYAAFDFLSFLAGYRYSSAYFVPDGSGIQDSGPAINGFTVGLSANIVYGRIDLAYEYKTMKYEDIYYSNTNYSYESASNFYFGYTITL
ncbi:MAG: outer membrane protein transport protein [Ignavibacteriaceae bacterium]|nr:outer membrane protein transport protein [Ignavibacteriaceae bacterium]